MHRQGMQAQWVYTSQMGLLRFTRCVWGSLAPLRAEMCTGLAHAFNHVEIMMWLTYTQVYNAPSLHTNSTTK